MGTKPIRATALWKKRLESDRTWRTGATRTIKFDTDEDVLVADIQNVIDIDNIPHDPDDETIDVVVVAIDAAGKSRNPRLFETRATPVTTVGLMDSSQTSLVHTAPAKSNDFATGQFIKVEDEILEITSGGGNTRPGVWKVERGIHGTEAVSHAGGTEVYALDWNVPHSEIVLSGDSVALGAPTLALSEDLWSFYIFITPPSDPSGRLAGYEVYRDTTPTATTLYERIPSLGFGQVYVHQLDRDVDDPSATYYFRMQSRSRAGVLSAYSNEVSGMVRTTGIDTNAEKPDPPTLTITFDGGGFRFGKFAFAVGVTESSTTGIGGVTKTQLQVAVHGTTHSTSTGFTATVFDDTKGGFRTIFNPQVTQSSTQLGGPYQFSARYFNEYSAAGVGEWSDWSTPATERTVSGAAADTSYPGPVALLDVEDHSNSDGNNILIEWKEPATNQWTIYGYQIQAIVNSGAGWPNAASLADALNLTSVSHSGTCDIVHGESQVTNTSVDTSGVNAGDILFLYVAADNSTGEVRSPFSAAVTAATAGTITFSAGWLPHDDTVGINFAVGPSWASYDYGPHAKVFRGPLAESGIDYTGGQPTAERFQLAVTINKTAHWRIRAENQYGWGQWVYHDALTGTVTRGSSVAFAPAKLGTDGLADGAVTGVKAALGFQAAATDVVFTPGASDSHRRVDWTAGTVYFADTSTEAVDLGNSGVLTTPATHWVYKDVGTAASSTLGVTSAASSAISDTRLPLALVTTINNTDENVTIIPLTSNDGGPTLSAATGAFGKLSAITVDAGELTAGTITGLLIRTASSGARIELTSSAFQAIDSGGQARVEIPSSTDRINFYDSGGVLRGRIDASTASEFAVHPVGEFTVVGTVNLTVDPAFAASEISCGTNNSGGILRVHGGIGTGHLILGTDSTRDDLVIDDSIQFNAFATEALTLEDAGSTSATEQDWIEVTVGGNTGYIRVFATK